MPTPKPTPVQLQRAKLRVRVFQQDLDTAKTFLADLLLEAAPYKTGDRVLAHRTVTGPFRPAIVRVSVSQQDALQYEVAFHDPATSPNYTPTDCCFDPIHPDNIRPLPAEDTSTEGEDA